MFLDVYLFRIPEGEGERLLTPSDAEVSLEIGHAGRRAELLCVTSARGRAEKYYAWRLLERALFERFGRCATELSVEKREGGGWHSPFCNISISHSEGGVAVAISSSPVGVDIEPKVPTRVKKFIKKALSTAELAACEGLPYEERDLQALRFWVMKESLFKMKGEGSFCPSGIDTLSRDGVGSFECELSGREYLLSVASEMLEIIKITALKEI